jgi:hypothetical protein
MQFNQVPSIHQAYVVPPPAFSTYNTDFTVPSASSKQNLVFLGNGVAANIDGGPSGIPGINDEAVYSMWQHFLDFAKSDSLSVVKSQRQVRAPNPYSLINPYTGKKRLSVFVQLSQQKPLVATGNIEETRTMVGSSRTMRSLLA